MEPHREHIASFLEVRVNVTNDHDLAQRVIDRAKAGDRRSVCAATVHRAIKADDPAEFVRTVDSAAFVTSDGNPLVQARCAFGLAGAPPVYESH